MTIASMTPFPYAPESPLRILLVEDCPGDARLIRERLYETHGLVADVTHRESLGEALAHLREDAPDVGLLDLGLPDATGVDAVQAVAGAAPDLPIVVLTGFDDRTRALEALRVGAQDYLGKNQLEGESLARSVRYAIERKRIARRAQDAITARDRVLGVVAHDLRNPLGVIALSAELIAGDVGTVEQKARQLDIIRRSAARMHRLVDDLLDVVRIESGQLALDLRHQCPDALITEAVEMHSGLAELSSRTIELRPASRSGPVLADHGRVMQVLGNLIGNAIKFTQEGGRIVVGAEAVGPSVRFAVEDDGSGIHAEQLHRLFDPFWQERRGGSAGAGLGLTIARGIVDAHGGSIWPESEVGRGTRMLFTLPLARERRVEDPPMNRFRGAHAEGPEDPGPSHGWSGSIARRG
jgi:signal transduction histidine kinase